MGVAQRVVQKSGGDESGGVCHVDHEDGSDAVGDISHALVVPLSAVGRSAADDESGLMFEGELFHFVVVYTSSFGVEVIADGVVEDAGGVDGTAVGEVSAMGEVEAHEGVAGVETGEEHGFVGLCAGVGLNVGELGSEEFFDSFDGQIFHFVYHLAAAVVAFAGQSLGVLVGEIRSHGLHHFGGDEVFGGNQFDSFQLPLMFLLNERKDFLIFFHCFNCLC